MTDEQIECSHAVQGAAYEERTRFCSIRDYQEAAGTRNGSPILQGLATQYIRPTIRSTPRRRNRSPVELEDSELAR